MAADDALALPLSFSPVYKTVVWGGRAMESWRSGLPEGPVGESWDLSDHDNGMSVVDQGALKGKTIRELVSEFGSDLVGAGFPGGDFPLLVKLIDANDRLSVQVHPDDDLATELGVGARGKTECWFMLGDGGELFQGTASGVDRSSFEEALATSTVEAQLNRFETVDGDFFHMPARTVHALGRGCLLFEIQQTCDVTFRVYDWGRLGLDGKPRETHVGESLATIDFSAGNFGPVRNRSEAHPDGGSVRHLVSCPYFTVEERRATSTTGGREGSCSLVINAAGPGELATAAGSIPMDPMRTYLVPASAGPWSVKSQGPEGLRLLVAYPEFP